MSTFVKRIGITSDPCDDRNIKLYDRITFVLVRLSKFPLLKHFQLIYSYTCTYVMYIKFSMQF